MYRIKSRDAHLRNDALPKRILTLDGGGLKGILTLGILQKIENILRQRHGNSDDFRLCHYFDLISGTSTGAIIAAALALGWPVEKLRDKYMSLGKRVFEKSFFRHGLLRAKYDHDKLNRELKAVYGEGTALGSLAVQTGLLIMTKRLDTGSPWPISNNPQGKYFTSRPNGVIGNGEYPLWQVVRASTAAPSYFDPETITIVEKPGHTPTEGLFVDGGVSPFNNPALKTFMYATMEGYRLDWPTGAEKLLLVSVGTGAVNPEVKKAGLAAKQAISAFLSLMDDSASLQETMLQWMSSSPTARVIDREVGELSNDLVAGEPLLTYLRYNVDLRAESVKNLDPSLTDTEQIDSLSAMDAPENMEVLHRLGTSAAEQDVKDRHFTPIFDLV
jgi:predicted acylesterase/phospholipase RssA